MIVLAVALCVVTPLLGQSPVKVYISVDMEGVVGAVTQDQLGPTGFEYGKFRELMTAEALAAIEGAREGGATQFVVVDSHGNGESLLIDRFPSDVQIIRGFPRPHGMMEGIDSSFAAVLFVAYHASTTSSSGVRAHTISSANLAAVRLNGTPMPEAGINAAVAGHFGVPVVMISGDDVAVREARSIIGSIAAAIVKRAIGFHAAQTMTPEAALAAIRQAAKEGVARRAEFKPYVLGKPVRVEVTFKNYRPAEVLSWMPAVERADAHTVRFAAKDASEVARFLSFVTNYQPDLTP